MNEEEQPELLVEEEAPAPAPAEEFEFGTLPPQITFQTERVPPPAWLYVRAGDRLSLWVWNSVVTIKLGISVRLLLPDGTISTNYYEQRPTGYRAQNLYVFPLVESFLLSVTIFAFSPQPAGSCYVRCLLMSGGGTGTSYPQGILAGYVAYPGVLAWPYPRFQNPVEGAGWLRKIEGTDPAPFTRITETVPTGARWKLLSVFCWLATSAAVGDRHVSLYLTDPSGIWLRVPPSIIQPASQTFYYTWAIGLSPYLATLAGYVARELPNQLTLTSAMQFIVEAWGMLAGDDFGPPRYFVEEWIEP